MPDKAVDMVLGIVKAFYETRVGEGSFPTEIGWVKSDNPDWQFPNMDINSKNPYLQGVGIRKTGNEYGATTGRSRRVGWLDLPLLRYVVQHSGQNVILTKLDVLSECKIINICKKYEYVGQTINVGQDVLRKGSLIQVAMPAAEILQYCKPIYKEFKGWECDIREIASLDDMSQQFKDIYDYVVREGGVSPRVLSVGADRNETIFV